MSTLVPLNKPKLPSYLSLPVGAEAISACIKDVPQFGSIELIFRADPLLSATRFRHLVEADQPHAVLRAESVRWEKKPSIGGDEYQEYLRGKWRLWAYPVRRALKAEARQLLVAQGLPRMAEWLALDRPPSWYFGRKHCSVVFVPKEETLRIEETNEAS
jgi:hypothetical protein